jgi:hypothetical protein
LKGNRRLIGLLINSVPDDPIDPTALPDIKATTPIISLVLKVAKAATLRT